MAQQYQHQLELEQQLVALRLLQSHHSEFDPDHPRRHLDRGLYKDQVLHQS